MLFWKSKKEKKIDQTEIENVIRGLTRNAISVEVVSNGATTLSGSRIGGHPYVTCNFSWPTFTGENYDGEVCERPLSFLGQINLSEVEALDVEHLLPTKGMLYFFYDCDTMRWGFDPKDRGCARVIYYDDLSAGDFSEADFPAALDEAFRFAPVALSFDRIESAPSWEEATLFTDAAGDWESYADTVEQMGMEEVCERHKLLGYADLIQGEMLTECERTARGLYCGDPESYQSTPEDIQREIQESASEWILLLQLSAVEEEGCEMMWGDCGNLYFYIRKQDLAARNFDRVWMILQCG